MNAYTQYQTANAISDMANNPGAGNNMMGILTGVGMGNVMTGTIHGATQPSGGPPPLPPKDEWYAGINGSQVGPMDIGGLRQLAQQGQLTPDTLIWKQGMAGWVAAAQIPDLAGLFAASPPPFP
jgi:hypothetical protein